MPVNISPEAIALQQSYAAHVYSLRGYLPNGDSLRAPDGDYFALDRYEAEEGAVIDLKGEFHSPPLFARIKEVPVKVHNEFDRKKGRFLLQIVAPKGAPAGRVEMVWPSKVVSSAEDLEVYTKRQEVEAIEIEPYAWRPDGHLHLPLPSAPRSVRLGAIELSAAHFQWHEKSASHDAELIIRFPARMLAGQLVITTANTLYQSSALLDPNQYKAAAQPPSHTLTS